MSDEQNTQAHQDSRWLWGVFIALWLACVGTALAIVQSTFESRKATQALESLRKEASGLNVISGQFLLEKSSWAAYSRVEAIAVKQLNMLTPTPAQTRLVYKD